MSPKTQAKVIEVLIWVIAVNFLVVAIHWLIKRFL
jgi:hypothetical protein